MSSDPRRPDDRELDDFLAGRSPLSSIYRDATREDAPAALDDVVMMLAREAARPPRRRWGPPMAIAATVVLSVGVVTTIVRDPELWKAAVPAADRGAAMQPVPPPPAPPAPAEATSAPVPAPVPASPPPPPPDMPVARPKLILAPTISKPDAPTQGPAPKRERKPAGPPAAQAAAPSGSGAPASPPSAPSSPPAAAESKAPASEAARQPSREEEAAKGEGTSSGGKARGAAAPAEALDRASDAASQAESKAESKAKKEEPRADRMQDAPRKSSGSMTVLPLEGGAADAAVSEPPRALPEPILAPGAWLERIRALRDGGEMDAARRELGRWRQTYPDRTVPDDLRPFMD